MGAGIFSVQGLLASAPLSVRLVTFVPWTVGILVAMLGRLLSNELLSLLNGQHLGRVATLDLLQLQTDRVLRIKTLEPLIKCPMPDQESSQVRSAQSERS